MNTEERLMLDSLLELKEVYGAYNLKVQLEAEGARIIEADNTLYERDLFLGADKTSLKCSLVAGRRAA